LEIEFFTRFLQDKILNTTPYNYLAWLVVLIFRLGTMTDAKTKIKVIEDADATGEVAKVYDEWRAHSGRQQMPGILKCFSHRPDFLREVMSFSNTVHFSEGHLTRKTKEAIASWVSWLNRCPY
jgi:alkylhydroperoxidase family enzyme